MLKYIIFEINFLLWLEKWQNISTLQQRLYFFEEGKMELYNQTTLLPPHKDCTEEVKRKV